MAKFIQNGNFIDYTAESAVTAGDVIVIGALVGIAPYDIAAGSTGVIATSGVFSIVAANGASITAGDVVYIDEDGNVTATASHSGSGSTSVANAEAGIALDSVTGDGTKEIRVLLK